MATTRTITDPMWVKNIYDAAAPRVVTGLLEADSQDFEVNDLVYLNAGAVTECGADPILIAGFALAPATNVTSGNTEIPIEVIRPGDVYLMNLYHATAASAVRSGVSIGTKYEIVQHADGWAVDMAATTNPRVVIVGFPSYPDDKADDIYARVLVQFLNTSVDNTTQRNNILQLGG